MYPNCQTSIHNIEFCHGCFTILIVYQSMLSLFISYATVLVRPDDPGTDRGSVTYMYQDQVTCIYNRMNSISRHISRKRYNKASMNVIYYINDKMSDTKYAEA